MRRLYAYAANEIAYKRSQTIMIFHLSFSLKRGYAKWAIHRVVIIHFFDIPLFRWWGNSQARLKLSHEGPRVSKIENIVKFTVDSMVLQRI